MSLIGRRDLLLALAALGAGVASGARASDLAVLGQIDAGGAARVGAAWLAAHPGTSTAALTRRLFPAGGANPEALARLRREAMDDFRHGRLFTHRGWRLSDTEGALMALLAAKA